MDLGPAGTAAWRAAVARCLPSEHPYLLPAPDRRTPLTVGPDWTGCPARVVRCLGRERALALLDERARACRRSTSSGGPCASADGAIRASS